MQSRTETQPRAVQRLTFGGVVDAEVRRPVDDDSLHGHVEALVEPLEAVGLEDLDQAVAQAAELSPGASFAHVGGQTGSGEVERVDEAERGGTGSTTGRQVTGEVAPELLALVDTVKEDLLVLVLEGEVESLGREVPDHVGQVAPPERQEALLLRDAHHAIHNALVLLVDRDLLAGMLDLRTDRETLRLTSCPDDLLSSTQS